MLKANLIPWSLVLACTSSTPAPDDDADGDSDTDGDADGDPGGEPERSFGDWTIESRNVVAEPTAPDDGNEYCGGVYALSLVPNGSELGLLWSESWYRPSYPTGDPPPRIENVRLTRIDADGTASDTSDALSGVPVSLDSRLHSLVWNGDAWSVVQAIERDGEREVYLQPVEADLSIGSEVRLTRSDVPIAGASAAWLGDALGIAYLTSSDSGSTVWYMRADPAAGVEEGSVRPLATTGTSHYPAVAADGGRLGAVFSDDREGQDDVFFGLVDESGEAADPDGVKVAATASASTDPVVAWMGTEFAVLWTEAHAKGTGEGATARFGLVSDDGVPAETSDVVLPFAGETGPGTADHPSAYHWPASLSWTGEDLLLVGLRGEGRGGYFTHAMDVFVLGVDASGAPDADGPTTVDGALHEDSWAEGTELRYPVGASLSAGEAFVAWTEHVQTGEANCRGDRWTLRVARLTRE